MPLQGLVCSIKVMGLCSSTYHTTAVNTMSTATQLHALPLVPSECPTLGSTALVVHWGQRVAAHLRYGCDGGCRVELLDDALVGQQGAKLQGVEAMHHLLAQQLMLQVMQRADGPAGERRAGSRGISRCIWCAGGLHRWLCAANGTSGTAHLMKPAAEPAAQS
jgi:hypothetical protein